MANRENPNWKDDIERAVPPPKETRKKKQRKKTVPGNIKASKRDGKQPEV